MLTRILALALCLCLSVTSRCSNETAERIELGFGVGVFYYLSYTVLKGNSGISKNQGISVWNFVPNSGLTKFCHSILIVETGIDLALESWTLRA